MVRYIFSGLLMATALAPAAGAQTLDTARQELELVARAEPACVTRSPAAAAGLNANFDPSGQSGGEIRIVQLVNQTTAEPSAASITLSIPVICNSSHVVTLRSQNGGLLRDTGDPRRRQSSSDFGEFVPYQVNFDWAGQRRNANSDASRTISLSVPRGAAGDATFRFELAGGGGPLVAGRYSDAIIIEFTPAN